MRSNTKSQFGLLRAEEEEEGEEEGSDKGERKSIRLSAFSAETRCRLVILQLIFRYLFEFILNLIYRFL